MLHAGRYAYQFALLIFGACSTFKAMLKNFLENVCYCFGLLQ